MTLPPEAFGKALAARAGIRADREKQEMSRHLNPIMNVVKAEAVPIGARVPGAAAVTSRGEEVQDHRAGMTAVRAGQEAVPERVADQRRLEAEAAAGVTAVVQARAVDSKLEHEAAAADRPEPRGGGIPPAEADKAEPGPPKAALPEARAVESAAAAAARSSRKILGDDLFQSGSSRLSRERYPVNDKEALPCLNIIMW